MCRMCAWNRFCRAVGPPMVMGFTYTVVPGVSYIKCEQLQAAMDALYVGDKGVPPRLVILDARRVDEYFMSHLFNATNIHATMSIGKTAKEDMKARLQGVEMDALIVLYCAVGLRSSWLGKSLSKMGYTNVKVLYHGFYEWANEGRPIYTHYPSDVVLNKEKEKAYQASTPPETAIHECDGKCYKASLVLPQHWIANLVLDSSITSKLAFPQWMYGKHMELRAVSRTPSTDSSMKEKQNDNGTDNIVRDGKAAM